MESQKAEVNKEDYFMRGKLQIPDLFCKEKNQSFVFTGSNITKR